jgi:hypothetical protein
MAELLAEMAGVTSGGNLLTGDMLTFFVDPALTDQGSGAGFAVEGAEDGAIAEDAGAGQHKASGGAAAAGFQPHRDRAPDEPRGSFRDPAKAHGPKYSTMWVALTNATPNNSCLYVVPRRFDSGYAAGDPVRPATDKGGCPKMDSPLQAVYESGGGGGRGMRAVRAVPVNAGGLVSISHRIIHWGSEGSPWNEDGPRIAMAMTFTDNEYEPHVLDPSVGPMPPVSQRVAAASGVTLHYSKRWRFDRRRLGWLLRLFNAEANKEAFPAVWVEQVRADYWESSMML